VLVWEILRNRSLTVTALIGLTASSTCLFGQVVYVASRQANVTQFNGGLFAYTINGSSGAVTAVPGSPFISTVSPSALTVDPTGKFLYLGDAGFKGSILAYSINASNGALTAVPGPPFPSPFSPEGLAIDPSGKFLYATNQNTVAAYAINASSGALTAIQGSPFPAGGLSSRVAADPAGKFLYVLNSGISVYTINAGSGALTQVAGSPFPAGTDPYGIAVHPTGKFVYLVSGNAIFALTVNTSSGALTAAAGSPFLVQEPNGLAMDPKGKFLYVTRDTPDVIAVYTIDSNSGALTLSSSFSSVEQGPSGIAVDPTGRFVYVVNHFSVGLLFQPNLDTDNVSAYAVNSSSGALTPAPGSPFPAGVEPTAIAIRSQPLTPAVPAITSLAPSSTTAGSPAFTLTVTGTGFLSGSTAQWNGTALTTTFVSATQLSAVVPASLIATAGSASVIVSNPGGMASKAVSFTIDPVSISISANGVVNGASHAGGAVSPGEIVTISGSNFGPGAFTGDQLDSNGYVTTSLAGTQALFDGVAAPLLSAQSGQVTAVVPYEVSGNLSTQLQISYQGQTSSAVSVPVAVAASGIFTADSSGSGQGLVFNEDGSANAPGNAASAGSTVVVYATGEGQTIPGGVDGKPGDPATPPVPVQTVTATIGGEDALVVAAGGISGMAAGYLQVSVQIPADVTVGDSAPIVLTIGGVASQANVTLAVQ
jgi:uncharacterized protein (TIGR03437 family)